LTAPASTQTYPPSLHDALPISNDSTSAPESITMEGVHNISTNAFKGSVSATSSAYSWVRDADAHYTVSAGVETLVIRWEGSDQLDRKSTRLNSSHVSISYAVFC